MTYVSLYRKYRPQTFADLLGQQHVSQTLANAITEDRVAHAYLFTGPRGTGKTSTARILAKALNCEKGPTPSPCGKCASCVAITEGSSLDVIEMDAASHSKVDETREVLAGVALATSGGRRKVYVIDEVHMLSAGSFNALLKTLEEPPSHVVFVLATTEAHKVLPTIVSRTQRFDFRRVPAEVIEEHLAAVAKSEDIDIEPAALGVIARHAEGGVRDALSALDQLASIAGSVTEDDAEALLGGRHEDSFVKLFDAVGAGSVGDVLVVLQSLMSQGADARQLALEGMSYVRNLLLLRTAPDAQNLLDEPEEDVADLRDQAEGFSPETLLRILDLLAKATTEMRDTPNHRLLLEVALVRAAAPETDPTATGLQGRIERLERRMGISGAAETESQTPPPTQRQAEKKTAAATRSTAAPVESVTQAPAAPTKKPAPAKTTKESRTEDAPSVGTEAQPGVPADVGFGPIKDAWSATLQEVGRTSKRIKAILTPSRPVELTDDVLTVEVQAPFHAEEMAHERNRDVLASSLHATLGVRPRLTFVARGETGTLEAPASAATTTTEPARSAPAESAPAAKAAEVSIEDTVPAEEAHDAVELVKRGLGAEVVEETS